MRNTISRYKTLFTAMTCCALLLLIDRTIEHRHLFWRGLDPNEFSGAATYIKLLSLNMRPNDHCVELLAKTEDISFEPIGPFRTAEDCGWESAVQLHESHGVTLSQQGMKLRCPASLAAHLWVKEINEIAVQSFGVRLASVTHAGTYSCRRMNHRANGEWSQHAYANAWDVLGFTLSNGDSVSVLRDWGRNSAAGKFLEKARDKACGIFGVVLGPEYNAAHRDHFHLDMGFGDACS